MSSETSVERRVALTLLGVIAVGTAAAIIVGLVDAYREDATARDSSRAQVSATAPGASDAPVAETATTAKPQPRSFTIAATGDLLIHGPVARAASTTSGWDFAPMFSSVAPILRAADLAVCHVESPMSPDNRRITTYPAFRVPRELADAIAFAGYDTCSLASNHATDAGEESIRGTTTNLDRVGVAHAGMARSPAERSRPTLLEAGGAVVAHLSYTYGFNNGDLPADQAYLSNVIDEATIIDEARRARAAGADFVMLSMHWGTGYTATPDDFQTELGPRLLASPHIDLIVGHHAHMVQPVVVVGSEYLAYGLGNFLSNQSPEACVTCPPGTQDGVILHFTVTENVDTGRWSVSAVSHTATFVTRPTFAIVEALDGDATTQSEVLARSAERTARALEALGIPVPERTPPGSSPTPEIQ